MTPDLEKIIPPMDEEGRALRIKAEHKLLNHVLKELDKDELESSEFRALVQSYCDLKRRDNEREKNTVAAALAQLRESARAANRNHPARRGSSLVRDSHLAPTFAGIPSRVPDQPSTAPDSPFGAPPGSSLSTGYADEQPQHVEETDPDVDPEWSLAPWGRRKNGKPRTEKEYRTILYRTVRNVHGLDLTEDPEKPCPDPITEPSSTPDALPPSIAATSAINHPTSDITAPTADILPPTSDIPHPTSDIEHPRSPPGRTEISPFCRPDAPFVPKVTNPWYDF